MVVVALLAAGLIVATDALAAPPCTKTGTAGHDELFGDGGRDVLCGKDGQDYVNGRGGPDQTRGGDGSDTLVGGEGWDRLQGLKGRDELFAVDGLDTEVLDGGGGEDRCYGDTGDQFMDCEHEVRVADA